MEAHITEDHLREMARDAADHCIPWFQPTTRFRDRDAIATIILELLLRDTKELVEENKRLRQTSFNEDNYVAWLHYKGPKIETCDSDAEGAFKVYRIQVVPASSSNQKEGEK